MTQVQIPNSLKRILVVTLALTFISCFVAIFTGEMTRDVHKDIKDLNEFLADAAQSQPNFEKSLEMYTDKTKDIIAFLLKLRPQNEEEYVTAISMIENIGQKLSLNMDMQSVENPGKTEKTLDYMLSFYGSAEDIKNLLKAMEDLPYFIKVKNVEYKNPKFTDEKELERSANVNILVSLYIK